MLEIWEYEVGEAVSYNDTELGLLSGLYRAFLLSEFLLFKFDYIRHIRDLETHRVGGLSAILIFKFN